MKPAKNYSRDTFFNFSIIVFTIAFCLFSFVFPDIAGKNVKTALNICSAKLIPSLFPTLVVSTFFSLSNIFDKFNSFIYKPLNKVLGIPKALSTSALLGLIAGYPVCAVCAQSMYIEKKCTKQQAEYTTAVCSNPSFAFILSAVGVGVLGNRAFGGLLIICMLISLIFTSFILRHIYCIKNIDNSSMNYPQFKGISVTSALLKSISQSAFLMMKICSFVIFFSCMSEFFIFALTRFIKINNCSYSMIKGFFEISGGIFSIDTNYINRAALIAFAVCGWSGMSVLFQISEIFHECGLSVKPYIVAKALNTFIFPLILQTGLLFLPNIL